MGLGMTMTLPAAIRIACDKAKYGFVFPRRGLTMESSSSFFLPRLIGYSHAMYLLTTGGVFPPTSPHFGSLFAETYPDSAQVVSRALELATEIAENVSPMASYLSRQLMWRGPASAEESHLVDSAVSMIAYLRGVGTDCVLYQQRVDCQTNELSHAIRNSGSSISWMCPCLVIKGPVRKHDTSCQRPGFIATYCSLCELSERRHLRDVHASPRTEPQMP